MNLERCATGAPYALADNLASDARHPMSGSIAAAVATACSIVVMSP